MNRRPPARFAVDRDLSQRPGVPMEHAPVPVPNTRMPLPRQKSRVKVFTHGRTGKTLTPVFGTAQPPRGVSGLARALAYRYPDHWERHWLLLLLADRIDLWQTRFGRLLRVGAFAAGGVLATRWLRQRLLPA
jgi:hypothetical protein